MFIMAIFVPFTYSIFNGVVFGFGVYLVLLVCTDGTSLSKKLRCCRKRLLPTVVTRHIRSWAAWGDPLKTRSLSLSGSMDRRRDEDNPDDFGGDYAPVGAGTDEDDGHNLTTSSKDKKSNRKIGGKWQTLIHKPGHLSIEEIDSDDDEIDEEDTDHDKILSFSLSAIGDGIHDDSDASPVALSGGMPMQSIIDIEKGNSYTSSDRQNQYVPPSTSFSTTVNNEIIGSQWNRSHLQLAKSLSYDNVSGSEKAVMSDHTLILPRRLQSEIIDNDDDNDVEVVL